MVGRWDLFGFRVLCIALMFHFQMDGYQSINLEGFALLKFRAGVKIDPYGTFTNWNAGDSDPCMWSGIHCADGNVQILDLKELSLQGILAPELGKLSHLRALVLSKNHFCGVIPKEIAGLTMLELLDLRANDLSGTIPAEIGNMLSLKYLVLSKNHFCGVIPKEIAGLTMLELLDLRANDLSRTIPAEIGNMLSLKYLLLCDNKFQGSIPTDFGKLDMLFERQYDQSCMTDVATGIDCINREDRHCIWQSSLQHLKNANSFTILLKQKLLHFLSPFKLGEELLHGCGEKCHESLPSSKEPYIVQNIEHLPSPVRRRILLESSNLPAAPISGAPPVEITNIPSTGSGSFPAIPNSGGNGKKKQSPAPASSPPIPEYKSSNTDSLPKSTDAGQTSEKVSERWRYVYVVPAGALLLTVAAAMLCICRRPGGAAIGPWKTGISGQLQKAFVTGVPKLNRAELETACEDFSNIIDTYPHFTLFKGTLSSGVEIAVASTSIASAKDWSKHSEMLFRTKIDTMSRINHKNFVNLLGYCEEEEPFLRMLVFEYPPSGSLFERLHAKEVEHLDWTARVRAIMGVAYCLQYMHHELNPPICHPCLESRGVLLTEDNAAKIAETCIWKEIVMKAKIPDDIDPSEMPPVEPENDVYNFGILMLEIISGKLPYSEEQGSLVDLATEYLNEKRSMSYMIDPSLKSFKHNELDAICEVIQDCIHQDPRERPTMNEAIAKLREVITVSPDAATPKLSPLWWAELEILSVEAS